MFERSDIRPPLARVTADQDDASACAIALERFAQDMRTKLDHARRNGRCGWNDPDVLDLHDLADLLCDALAEGDLVSVGNYAMMLHARMDGAPAAALAFKGSAASWAEAAMAEALASERRLFESTKTTA